MVMRMKVFVLTLLGLGVLLESQNAAAVDPGDLIKCLTEVQDPSYCQVLYCPLGTTIVIHEERSILYSLDPSAVLQERNCEKHVEPVYFEDPRTGSRFLLFYHVNSVCYRCIPRMMIFGPAPVPAPPQAPPVMPPPRQPPYA